MHETTAMLRQTRATIGRKIHYLRQQKKLPLCKLARLTSIDPMRIDQFELGKHEIRMEEILKIAWAMKVKPGWFFEP